MSRRGLIVYGILFAAWAVVVGWQVAEHVRVRVSARAALINRAKDISNTLGLVMRSQRRFGDVIFKDRLESALNELVKPGELNAIALLNAAREVVASAGAPIDFEPEGGDRPGEYWTDQTVTLMNLLVDLGTNVTREAEEGRPTIILPSRERSGRSETNRPPPPPALSGADGLSSSNGVGASSPPERTPGRFRPRDGGEGRRPFGRPFWMSEEEYQSMIQKQGVHSFVIVLS